MLLLLIISCMLGTSAAFSFLKSRTASAIISSSRLPLRMMSAEASLREALAKAEAKIAQQTEELREIERYFISRSMLPSKASLKDLCVISREACQILQPMIKTFYLKCSESYGTAKLKSDATFFSIADGMVQHLLVEYLFSGNKFGQIVGEEDETNVNILRKPYTVDDLIIPPEFDDLVETTRDKIVTLAKKIDPKAYKGVTVFVDPIDGTREFATGKGEYCSILIGYNNLVGKPVAGIIYRPLTEPPTWAAGAKSEDYADGVLDTPKTPNPRGVLVSDGVNTPFLENVIAELKYEKIPCYASGNRALMLIEGKAGAYIRDTGGFAKWDTSGPQAVIEAFGGAMSKLPKFISNKKLESYTYLKTNENLDFEPGQTLFTLSNAKDKRVARMVRDVLVPEVELVKEYACLCGLLAVDKINLEVLDSFHDAMIKVKDTTPPMYT